MPNYLKLRVTAISLGLLIFNCLQFTKVSKFDSEKEVSREFEKVKSDYKVEYSLTTNSIIFTVTEIESAFDKVKKEKTYKVSKQADTSTRQNCISEVYGTYWECMLGLPVMTLGIGFVVTIPIMLYDWLSYPFYAGFSETNKVILEDSVPVSKKEIISTRVKLRFKNEESKFDRSYSVRNGKIEIPFTDINVNYLWNSGLENVSTKYYFYYSILDPTGRELISSTLFDSAKFREDVNFNKLSNKAYDLEKKKQFNVCSKKFGLDNIRDGYKHIADSGLYLKESEIAVRVILNRACYNYRGTTAFDKCVNDFEDCIRYVRYIDNKNLNYE